MNANLLTLEHRILLLLLLSRRSWSCLGTASELTGGADILERRVISSVSVLPYLRLLGLLAMLLLLLLLLGRLELAAEQGEIFFPTRARRRRSGNVLACETAASLLLAARIAAAAC